MKSIEVRTSVTAMTVSELYAGVAILPEGKKKATLRKVLDRVLSMYPILSFDFLAAQEYAEVVSRRRQSGQPISTVDAQIAAVCRANNAVCATRNVKDFENTGVRLINPWD
ncbi:PIN domain-containing protein [Corynebacterium striatum]